MGKTEVSFHNPKCDSDKNDYCYLTTKSFIHYTSLNSAINIFNDGYFRLYNLTYLNDPQELIYAGNNLLGNYTNEELKKLKEKAFCISLCKYDESSDEHFDNWRFYGLDGYGVGIVFKFTSMPNNWSKHFLSKIYYGNKDVEKFSEEPLEKFKRFRINHDNFLSQHNSEFEIRSRLFGRIGKIPEWIGIFLAFHKDSCYKTETEIRFLRFYEDTLPNDILNTFSINRDFEKTFYDKLYIKTSKKLKSLTDTGFTDIYNLNKVEQLTLHNPLVSIEKIIIGYRHKTDFEKLKRVFKQGLLETTEFNNIEIELSSFSERFQN